MTLLTKESTNGDSMQIQTLSETQEQELKNLVEHLRRPDRIQDLIFYWMVGFGVTLFLLWIMWLDIVAVLPDTLYEHYEYFYENLIEGIDEYGVG